MKKMMLVLAVVLVQSSAWASTYVRCSGKTEKNVTIGLDFEITDDDKLESVTDFIGEDPTPLNPESFESASRFFMWKADGTSLEIVGFRTINDGLDNEILVSWVKGNPSMSNLQIGSAKFLKAVSNINCRELKKKTK